MRIKRLLLAVLAAFLLSGTASAQTFNIGSGAYRNNNTGVSFRIPVGWKETEYSVSGVDEAKCYIYPTRTPEMIIFCSRDIWLEMSPMQRLGKSRSSLGLDKIGAEQAEKLLENFNLKNGELQKAVYGGNTYLKTTVTEGTGVSQIHADAVFMVQNGYCFLFLYSDLEGRNRHYSDFEALLNSAQYSSVGGVTPRVGFFICLATSFLIAFLPMAIYMAAVLRGRFLNRAQARRAATVLTAIPGIAVSAVLFLLFDNLIAIFVFALCTVVNYAALSGGMRGNVLSYSIELAEAPEESEALLPAEEATEPEEEPENV